MKELLIMRHAKSSWSDADLKDFERTLNKRGRKDASRMGTHLYGLDLVPQAILSSAAQRTRETVVGMIEIWGQPEILKFPKSLYLGGMQEILDALWGLEASVQRAILVGHNPGMEMMVEALGRRHERMQTAAIAHFEVEISQWADIRRDSIAQIKNMWRPKEI